MEGLKFHFGKLNWYTNPTGGAIDKILLNNKAWTKAYYAHFASVGCSDLNPLGEASAGIAVQAPQAPVKPYRYFLSKKALYQVADHLLGIGSKAYWTGSTRKSTLLGLDIDDHESSNQTEVQANAEHALYLFKEMTGLDPYPCKSGRGINAYLIVHKARLSTMAINENWHSIVRLVNKEAKCRGLIAKLECKGKARIFDSSHDYCGVQFKDPFSGLNPTDEQLHSFWDYLEANALSGGQLHSLATTLHSQDFIASQAAAIPPIAIPIKDSDDLISAYKGEWAQQCREWAILGLPCEDSMTTVVRELAKWLYFVELWTVPEPDRLDQVANSLIDFCFKKHNGFITRLNRGQEL